jgi:hypothetical protein
MPGLGGIRQVDRDLAVVDLAGGAGVLALHPSGGGALLQIAGLVDDQHRLRVAEMADHVVAHVIAQGVGIPHRPGEQVLQSVRAGGAGVLGDRPAVLAWQVGQQPTHQRPGVPPRLHPTEPARDAAHQLVKRRPPADGVYAVACGHRLISGCRHNTGSSTVVALACSPAPDQQHHELRLED